MRVMGGWGVLRGVEERGGSHEAHQEHVKSTQN